jgi:hypothetical protein
MTFFLEEGLAGEVVPQFPPRASSLHSSVGANVAILIVTKTSSILAPLVQTRAASSANTFSGLQEGLGV